MMETVITINMNEVISKVGKFFHTLQMLLLSRLFHSPSFATQLKQWETLLV